MPGPVLSNPLDGQAIAALSALSYGNIPVQPLVFYERLINTARKGV